jgi:hypothetical protein
MVEGDVPVRELRTEVEGIFPPGRDVVRSPYFPYRKLYTTWVIEGECQQIFEKGKTIVMSGESRYLIIHKLWNVFWVEIVPRGSQSETFGPYRLHRQRQISAAKPFQINASSK